MTNNDDDDDDDISLLAVHTLLQEKTLPVKTVSSALHFIAF